MIDLKFNTTLRNLPDGVRQETEEEVLRRQENKVPQEQKVSGMNILESVDRVYVANFVKDLQEAGYVLVSAFVRGGVFASISPALRRLVEQRKPSPDSRVSVIFRFVHPDFLDSGFIDSGWGEADKAQNALRELTQDVMWRSEVWDNPFFEEQTPVEGQHMFSINMVSRQSLKDQNGMPLSRWLRDNSGDKLEKISVDPKFVLALSEDGIEMLNYEDRPVLI
ncbi:MAG: hypothetical protein A3H51_02275 [Candidatus Spechtbacteria bacterium RIFCSPLOWO2_02_FULL_38_8]|uniref:Uncharacterized protein n=1 Tax=Candidatus Spechtbacteria bacterium RIFCSPLOWO2_02_FULL_38_8 TaxID=1802164 RepID=A0A1G2HLL4_9BACT|nr:MAG: hypothetical protein A3H51_02275 [Candidatus Spechtbacteria bacterium RIFCSPLOWO2_02_FULL_38_8]